MALGYITHEVRVSNERQEVHYDRVQKLVIRLRLLRECVTNCRDDSSSCSRADVADACLNHNVSTMNAFVAGPHSRVIAAGNVVEQWWPICQDMQPRHYA